MLAAVAARADLTGLSLDPSINTVRSLRFTSHPQPKRRCVCGAVSSNAADRRRLKRLGLRASAGVLVASATLSIATGLVPLPSARDTAIAFAAGSLASSAAVVTLWGKHAGRVHTEWHQGRIYIETGVPPAWSAPLTPVAPKSIEVRDTGSIRGNGAYAILEIPQGAYLGNYEGELLSLNAYYARYPAGVVRANSAIVSKCRDLTRQFLRSSSKISKETYTYMQTYRRCTSCTSSLRIQHEQERIKTSWSDCSKLYRLWSELFCKCGAHACSLTTASP